MNNKIRILIVSLPPGNTDATIAAARKIEAIEDQGFFHYNTVALSLAEVACFFRAKGDDHD